MHIYVCVCMRKGVNSRNILLVRLLMYVLKCIEKYIYSSHDF